MFLPIGDSPNPDRFTPWVNYGLIAANVVVFFLTFVPLASVPAGSGGDVPLEAVRWLRRIIAENPGYVPSQYDVFTYLNGFKPGAPELSDLFLSMFLHAGWSHLLGNMLFLWIYGDNVEHRLGRVRYLLLYLTTGLAATVTFALMSAGSLVPMVGASGAISGVLGMYFIMFPRNVVKVFMFIFPFFFGIYPINARVVLGFYIIVQNIFPALFTVGQGGGVAYGAHIGGFVAGVAAAWLWETYSGTLSAAAIPRPSMFRSSSGTGPVRARLRQDRPSVAHESSQEEALKISVEAGDRQAAFRHLGRISAPVVALTMPNEAIVIARWLADDGQLILALELVKRVLRRYRAPQIDQADAFYTLGLIRLKQGQPTTAYQHFMDALDFQPKPDTMERIKKALAAISVYRRLE